MYIGGLINSVLSPVLNMLFMSAVLFQPVNNQNKIFSCTWPQTNGNRRGRCYTAMHMRFHLIRYVEENYDLMTSILKGPLEVRCMVLDIYLRKMHNCETCGYEITLLILTHMYKVPILVIRSDMLWLSSNVTTLDCPIGLVQNSYGQFLGTKTKYLVFVGDLPKVKFPKKLKAKKCARIVLSTPVQNNNLNAVKFGSSQQILSPILDESGRSAINHDHTYSVEDEETKKLREEVRQFKEANLSTTVDEVVNKKNTRSMSTEFPKYNVMESSVDGSLRSGYAIDSANESSPIFGRRVESNIDAESTGKVESKFSEATNKNVSKTKCSLSDVVEDGEVSMNSVHNQAFVNGDGSIVSANSASHVGDAAGTVNSELQVLGGAVISELSPMHGDESSLSTVLCSLNSVQSDKISPTAHYSDQNNNPDGDITVTASNNEDSDSDATISISPEHEEEKESTLVEKAPIPSKNNVEIKPEKEKLQVLEEKKKKIIVKIVLKDISKELGNDISQNSSFTVDTDKDDKCNVLVSYACNKCNTFVLLKWDRKLICSIPTE